MMEIISTYAVCPVSDCLRDVFIYKILSEDKHMNVLVLNL